MTRISTCLWLGLALVWTGACGGDNGSSSTGGSASPPTDQEGPALSQIPKSAPKDLEPEPGGNFLTGFPLNRIVSGGVVKDGIPALTDPMFVSPSDSRAAYVRENDIVMGLYVNGEAKAYPHNIGWWHEIVNDEIGGEPVVVTLCPLTGTGMVFSGEGLDGERIKLGVSGRLFNNNLIMYDRRDPNNNETWYPQMLGEGVTGPRKGEALELLPVVETTWRFWKELHPETVVVSEITGFNRSYTTYPYGSYREPSSGPSYSVFPSLFDNAAYDLFEPKEMTLGVRFGDIAMAYPFATMATEAVINDDVAGEPIVVVYYERERMALAFDRTVNGDVLTFERVGNAAGPFPFALEDTDTGTTWNLLGEALDGPLAGNRLRQLPAHNAFWFAWSSFWQNTGVH